MGKNIGVSNLAIQKNARSPVVNVINEWLGKSLDSSRKVICTSREKCVLKNLYWRHNFEGIKLHFRVEKNRLGKAKNVKCWSLPGIGKIDGNFDGFIGLNWWIPQIGHSNSNPSALVNFESLPRKVSRPLGLPGEIIGGLNEIVSLFEGLTHFVSLSFGGIRLRLSLNSQVMRILATLPHLTPLETNEEKGKDNSHTGENVDDPLRSAPTIARIAHERFAAY